MTNYDKHKDKILKLAKERYSGLYIAEALAAHDISRLADANNVIKWLFDEYEPLLLKNGDGLKPGDWIMVRDVDSQSFVRRQFLYFFDGKFICSAPNHAPLEGFGEPWVQARLPEDGE